MPSDAPPALVLVPRDLLRELADELSAEIDARYPLETRNIYPSMQRRYDRDMQPVRRAWALLREQEAGHG